MKTRIIAAVILIPVLLLLLLVAPKIVAAIVLGLMLAIGVYELIFRTGLVRHPRMVIYSCVMAFAASIWSYFGAVHAYAVLGILVFVIALFAEMMANHVKVRFETVCLCIMAGLVVPYLLSSMVRILVMKIGRYVIFTPFIVAFLSDAGAYFVGIRYGRHKLAPVVSPNKSFEGVLGGLAAAMLGMIIYAAILHIGFDFRVNYGYALLYGLAGSAAGVFGDLCFSAIKRQTGIKDYGNLIPGHGGVLDRFDSMMTVGPLVEALLVLLPFAVG